MFPNPEPASQCFTSKVGDSHPQLPGWFSRKLTSKELELTLVQAAELMGVCYRQSKRIWKQYQLDKQHEVLSLVRRQVIVRTLRNGREQLVYRGQP